ncbi:hypothetical protein HPP92_015685 [Vanilla planifolia]|uniref:Reticulon-like protein n=1 Tax=Vanilla planifolia TaxID=51239 RepID=A0A835UTX8_VANPL|nr:hypothetical protein HPP92_015685 [Vanilla planifolia]
MHDHKGKSAEKLWDKIESIADAVPKQMSGGFSNGKDLVSEKMNKLFGRQKTIHHIFGGGKSADLLLWRNKKISSGALIGATLIWGMFEFLEYHFFTMLCFALVVGMIVQFIWTNASGLMNRSPSDVPRLVLPNELFVNVAVSIGAQINLFLGFLQDVSCGNDLKIFIMVVLGLWAAAIIGSWCNFLTVLYVGFVAVHTIPVLYEKYEDQVDEFVYNLIGQLQHQYRKLDDGVLSKIPKGNLKVKKAD